MGARTGIAVVAAAIVCATVARAQATDPSRLPIGDGKVSNTAKRGMVWSCNPAGQFPGRGGAHAAGAWIKPDGTFDFTAKPTVDGSVSWPHRFSITLLDSVRRIAGNDLPNHPTGMFPVSSQDDAFNYDRNPNSIRAQEFSLELKATPSPAAQATCLPMGPIGVLLSGGYFFNALDLRGEDAVAHEIQDGCQGHPQNTGAYHYHNLSSCVADSGTTHSQLVGYAFDGFGIFGKRGENGRVLSNVDLDECHGHTHAIQWDGRSTNMYHYHATWEYPYTIGCFRGTPAQVPMQPGRGRGRGPGAAPQPPQAPAGAAAAALSVITLGTGSPRYDAERAGPANAIRIGDRYIIVDAGNGVQARLQETGIPLESIDAILITHHHLDHNQELIPLVITTMVRGQLPEIIGSPGTVKMMDVMRDLYAGDIQYRMARAPAPDVDPTGLRVRDLNGGERFTVGQTVIRSAQVNHSIHTVAYRFESGGSSIVISGDLSFSPSLIDLAKGADVLVIDSGNLPALAGANPRGGRAGQRGPPNPPAAGRGGRMGQPPGGRAGDAGVDRAHPTLAEVASMAQQAGVKCLVLSHIAQQAVDEGATLAQFKALYSGVVVVAKDRMEISAACGISSR